MNEWWDFINLPENEYRVVRNTHTRFEAQIRKWWFPVWTQIGYATGSKEGAMQIIRTHKDNVVWTSTDDEG